MKFVIPFGSWARKAGLEVDIPSDTKRDYRLRAALMEAVNKGANLEYANLEDANLEYAGGGIPTISKLKNLDGCILKTTQDCLFLIFLAVRNKCCPILKDERRRLR